jgi:ribulose 1,5-bisphosphate synthetase/thiazole synthase
MGSMGYKVAGDEYTHPLISERAIDEPRSLKVIYVGAGVSGICAAIQFPKFLPTVELAIYEKNADVGGTWFENRYPVSRFTQSLSSDPATIALSYGSR